MADVMYDYPRQDASGASCTAHAWAKVPAPLGAVTHLFYPPSAGGKFHLGGLIVSIIGAILVLYIWHKFRLQLPRG